LKSLGLFLDYGFDLLNSPGPWACSPTKSPGKTQEGQKIPRPGLWVQEEPRPCSNPSSILIKF